MNFESHLPLTNASSHVAADGSDRWGYFIFLGFDAHGGFKFVPLGNVPATLCTRFTRTDCWKIVGFSRLSPIFSLLENFVGSDFVFVALFSVGAFIVDLSCNADAEVLALEAFSPCLCCFCTGKCF